MAEEVLSDTLLNALSKKIDIALYPASDFAVDLGFDFAAASAAEQHSFQTLNPQGKYEHLLKKFVDTHGRGAKDLIDIFKDKQKKDLVNFLEEAIKRQNALKQSGLAEGQRQTGINTNARNKSVWKSIKGLSVVVALLAIVVACTWNNIFPEPRKCASSPCQNGGTCHERRGEYSCKCKTGYEGSNCEIEPRKCASSPCQNGGTCHELQSAYSCTCKTGYGDSNCEIEYIAENFSLEECQDTLRRHYKNHLFNINTKPWNRKHDVDLEKLYTTVSLYKVDKNNIPDGPLQNLTLNGSTNDIFQTKVRGSLPKRIVLFGEAGRGKTTAIAKMAYDWANHKEDSPLKNVKLLFVFKMRNMNAQTAIAEAIVPLLEKKYKKYNKTIEDYIDSHEKDIVMLFDGYDEFSGKIRCGENVVGVIDILCQESCSQCRILVTSRPVRREDFYGINVYYASMVIEGYSQQHATDFIEKFFLSNETKGTELKKYLEEDIVTNEMIATPLFCTMVCYLWNEGYIHGNFTRTKLFDDIMEFLRTHLNRKNERDREIKQDLLDDTVVSVGHVAFTKLSNKSDLNPLMFIEEDFSEVHDDKVNIGYLLGLLTNNTKTDSDFVIYIEFFHKLAQEYSAGRYLVTALDEGKISDIGFSVVNDMKEIFQFASGTSVSACRKFVASLIEGYRVDYLHMRHLYHQYILDFISEGGTCAEQSETYLTRLLTGGTLHLPVTASAVVGFDKLPGSVKEKITSIDIFETTNSPYVFARLWNSMHTCIHLTHVEMYLDVPPTISPLMEPLYHVNSFTTALQRSADDYMQLLMFLPDLRELIIDPFHFQVPGSNHLPVPLVYQYISVLAPTSDVLVKLWDRVNSSSLLNRLVLPIYANIGFNLKHLTSIRVFETNYVISVNSLAHVLTFLPKVRELIIHEIKPVELDNNTKAFCELWNNLHTSPDLNRLVLPFTAHKFILCDLEPLRSVQVLETKSSSIHLPIVLKKLPNLKKLLLYSDMPEYQEVYAGKIEHNYSIDFWSVHILRDLVHLKMDVPNPLTALLLYLEPLLEPPLEPLKSVQTLQIKIKCQIEVFFPKLLSWLPNISELDVFVGNDDVWNMFRTCIMPIADTYYNKVVSDITYGLVKNVVHLKVLNMTFDPRRLGARKSVSRDTVENFIQMLKTSDTMRQLDIISLNYCVFNESDLIEIITAIRGFTSIMLLRIDCCLYSEGELSRFAIQQDQTQEKNQDINMSVQSWSLLLTLFYSDPQRDSRTEKRFVLPRSQ